jgi:limonene-1,2-epoxide hydrolase
MDEYSITKPDQIVDLWSKTYNETGKPDWSHIWPYYDDNILFKDSIQEIRGIKAFREMTQRLAERSNELYMKILRTAMEGNVIFVEWEMTINYKKTRNSKLYGASRITLNESGKIKEQRDYYDLWGDIFDNIPRFEKLYRKFMKDKFG